VKNQGRKIWKTANRNEVYIFRFTEKISTWKRPKRR